MPARKKRSRKKTGATRNTEQSFSTLSMIVIGLLVGGFVGFLVYLDKIPTKAKEQSVLNKELNKQSSSQNNKKKQAPKHEFDFYTVLPDRKVEAIEVEDRKPVRKTITQTQKKSQPVVDKAIVKKPVVQANILYQLQVGAFFELSKADAMKARLAFLGIESNIQVIQNNGKKMYRVRVGPSTDSQKINRIKSQLKTHNINTFVQKISS